MRQKITPFLWFDGQAEEAANFYVSVFKDARITNVSRYRTDGARPAGAVLTVTFELFGQEFVALNGGPEFAFTPATSFYIDCESQAEVDYYWEKLLEGGQADACGWLRDKYGLSWQIVPRILNELLEDKDPAKAGRVMNAMLEMVKLDVATLKAAYEGR